MSLQDSSCTIVAIFTPKPEFRTAVRDLLLRVTPRVHEEPVCEFYTLNEEVTGKLIYLEAWTTRRHWLDHMKEPTVAEILGGVEGKLEREVDVYEMYNLPTGLSGKGTLRSS